MGELHCSLSWVVVRGGVGLTADALLRPSLRASQIPPSSRASFVPSFPLYLVGNES